MRRCASRLGLGLALAIALTGALGCWPTPTLPEDFGECVDADPGELPSPIDAPSYHADVRPIFERECTSCHTVGGIAPFSLDDHASALAFGQLALDAVDAGVMPPWPPSRCCAPLMHERELYPHERAVIARWLELGGPEGDPATAPPPPQTGLSRVDLELTMPEPYTPTPTIGELDDHRCFLLDWPLDEPTYVTGLEVVPGHREIVHHAIVYAISEIEVPLYNGLDDGTPEPGWSCPGGVLESAEAYIGSWVPGAGAVEFPEGLGRRVHPLSRVLLDVHYELSAGAAPDQTGVRFRLDDAVATEVQTLAVMNPSWAIGNGMKIPAGDADVQHDYAYDPATWFNLGQPIQIHGASLHMHELGSRASLAILRSNGDIDCLLHIPAWDFGWQGEYYLAQPITVGFGDRIYVECHFDNSAANQPGGAAPKDLRWGDDGEMCIGALTVSR